MALDGEGTFSEALRKYEQQLKEAAVVDIYPITGTTSIIRSNTTEWWDNQVIHVGGGATGTSGSGQGGLYTTQPQYTYKRYEQTLQEQWEEQWRHAEKYIREMYEQNMIDQIKAIKEEMAKLEAEAEKAKEEVEDFVEAVGPPIVVNKRIKRSPHAPRKAA